MTHWNTMQPLTPDAAHCKIVLAAFIDGFLVDSVAFDDEAQIPEMKALLLSIYRSAVILRKTDHTHMRGIHAVKQDTTGA
jgi:hypothetical protein